MKRTESSTRPRIWSPTFVALIFISLATTAIVDALQAALPIFTDAIGRSRAVSGALVSVFAIAGIVPFLASGALVDRIGSRKVMIGGAAIFLLGLIGPLFWTSVGALFFFRVVQGIGFAATNVGSAAGAANVTPRERLGEGLGFYGLGQSISVALGPAIGLALVVKCPDAPTLLWQTLSLLAALCLIASACCSCDPTRNDVAAIAAREKRDETSSFLALFIEKRAFVPSLTMFVMGIGVCLIIVYAGLFFRQLEFGSAAIFYILAAAAMLATRFCSGLFMDKYPPVAILLSALALSALAFVMLSFAPNRLVALAASVPFGLGFGTVVPLLSSVAVKRSPRNRVGVANSMFYLFLNLSFAFGGALGGKTIDAVGFRNAFLFALLTVALPAAFGLLWMRKDAPLSQEASTQNG